VQFANRTTSEGKAQILAGLKLTTDQSEQETRPQRWQTETRRSVMTRLFQPSPRPPDFGVFAL
jgi:hypothetical protein